MSEFHVEVVTVGEITKHPNADSLSITKVRGDYPVIIKTGEFQVGDKAVYLPIDSMVKVANPRFAFLANKDNPRERERIKAKRLRGIFSMGMLTQADPAWNVGQNVQTELDIQKYEPPPPLSGDDEKDPGFIPCYTDIEGLRAHPHLLKEGEEVVLTEKLHGENGRWCFRDGRLWCGSHVNIKKESENNGWWKIARKYDLAKKLSEVPGIVVYGEVHGMVGGFPYGPCLKKRDRELKLALFDALDTQTNAYFDYDDFLALAKRLGLPIVPELYRGPWKTDLRSLAEGNTTIEGAKHVREGFVVRPIKSRFEETLGGRLILKLHGEEFLLK